MKKKNILLFGIVVIIVCGCIQPDETEKKDIKTCLYYYGDELNDLSNENMFKTAANYDLLILTESNSNPQIISKLKSYNPDAKIVLYTVSTQLPNPRSQYVTPSVYPKMQEMYYWIENNHPEWFLRDSDNNIIYASSYINIWQFMNPTTGWTNYYVQKIEEWITNDYDGVYFDVAMTYDQVKNTANEKQWNSDPGEYNWNQAMLNMINKVHVTIGKNKLAIYNDGYNAWLDVSSGRLHEWWMQYDMNEPIGGNAWLSQLQLSEETVSTGKSLCVAHYGYGEEQRIYGLASLLLISNDNAYYYFNDGGSIDYVKPLEWYEEYNIKIGSPKNNYYVNNGLYIREFDNAKVIVNPSTTTRELEGIILSPKSAKILMKK